MGWNANGDAELSGFLKLVVTYNGLAPVPPGLGACRLLPALPKPLPTAIDLFFCIAAFYLKGFTVGTWLGVKAAASVSVFSVF